jgi:hypothetical protein
MASITPSLKLFSSLSREPFRELVPQPGKETKLNQPQI